MFFENIKDLSDTGQYLFPMFNILNIGIKHVFPCINICWVPRESALGFQHRPRNRENVNARKNMFDRYYCIKVSKKSI